MVSLSLKELDMAFQRRGVLSLEVNSTALGTEGFELTIPLTLSSLTSITEEGTYPAAQAEILFASSPA